MALQLDSKLAEFQSHCSDMLFLLLSIQEEQSTSQYDEALRELRLFILGLEAAREIHTVHRRRIVDAFKKKLLRGLNTRQVSSTCSDLTLVCDGRGFRPEHGFGWRMTHATLCLAAAIASGRRMAMRTEASFLLEGRCESVAGDNCPQSNEEEDNSDDIRKGLYSFKHPTRKNKAKISNKKTRE